ncbi:DUF3440 domain-containing protein [Vibrio sp. VNB-15]
MGKKKSYLSLNVYDAARQRLKTVFESFDHVYVSFSGGKDSGVLLHLALEQAERYDRLPLDVLIVDFEAQYQETERFIKRMLASGKINPIWVCLPLSLRNSVSQFQPKWVCWHPDEKSRWVRQLPESQGVVSDIEAFPFFEPGMEFEDFVFEFAGWYQKEKAGNVAVLIGLRSDESHHRFNTIKNGRKETFQKYKWTTKMRESVFMAYPIYDWKVSDVWIANSRFDWDYNRIYELMYKAGVPLSQQRLCQPFGDDQRKGLWLYRELEPETWARLVHRVAGANFGARYSKTQGRVVGYYRFSLPHGWSYREYSKFLLKTMPSEVESHYRERIFKFLCWWRKHGPDRGICHIPDYADSKLEAKKQVPSWRRICKVLVKNDYFCRGLSFSCSKNIVKKQRRSPIKG